MTVIGIFGIGGDGSIGLITNLLVLGLIATWFATIYWTYSDAKRRIEDPVLVFCATAAALFPIVGCVIYMIVRPPEFIEDARERELEIQAAEARLLQHQNSFCGYCDYPVDKDFLLCPSCLRKLREQCTSCHKPMDMDWRVCPYCAHEVVSS